jgi:hypothetical protein
MPYKHRSKMKAIQRRSHRKAYEKDPLKFKTRTKKYRQENWARVVIADIRRRAQKKNIAFDLDQHQTELESRLNKLTCEISGAWLTRETPNGPYSPSIDRRDPSKGYVYSNVRVICFALNTAFGSWGEEVFSKIYRTWRQQNGQLG